MHTISSGSGSEGAAGNSGAAVRKKRGIETCQLRKRQAHHPWGSAFIAGGLRRSDDMHVADCADIQGICPVPGQDHRGAIER